MSSAPKLTPPPDGDVSRGPALLIMSAVFGVLSTVSTVIRLSVRASSRKLGYDDLTIFIAMILLIAQIVVSGFAIGAGFGRHQYYLTVPDVERSLEFNYVAEVLLFVIIPMTKISICLFVLRIRQAGWLKWLLYAVIAGLIITTLAPIIVLFAQCRPISAFWDKQAGQCWSPKILNDVNYFQVAYSILSDLICSLLPIFILRNVQMRRRLKFAICGLMSLGLIATACAIVRMSLFAGNLSLDLSWTRSLISIWCLLEEALGIICANLALSGYVYQFFIDSRWSRKHSYQSSSRRQLDSTLPVSRRPGATQTSTTIASHDSALPLDEYIHKTHEFTLEDERHYSNYNRFEGGQREWKDLRHFSPSNRV